MKQLTLGWTVLGVLALGTAAMASPVSIEAAKPDKQVGSMGADHKAGSLYCEVLGSGWGSTPDDTADYTFAADAEIQPAFLHIRYARQFAGSGALTITLDGAVCGVALLPSTGGRGDDASQFHVVSIAIPALRPGTHHIALTASAAPEPFPPALLSGDLPRSVGGNRGHHPLRDDALELELVGNRIDKNTVGGGANVAVYTGTPSRFFYATYEVGDVFSVADGGTVRWFPDYEIVGPTVGGGNVNLDELTIDGDPDAASKSSSTNLTVGWESLRALRPRSLNGERKVALSPSGKDSVPVFLTQTPDADGVLEQRRVCVMKNDVVISRLFLINPGAAAVTHQIDVTGDCRASVDYRGQVGGVKTCKRVGDAVVMTDGNAFPHVLPNGLVIAVLGDRPPTDVDVSTAGVYRMSYDVTVPAHGLRTEDFACAFARDEPTALARAGRVFSMNSDPFTDNHWVWRDYYERDAPRFECSDRGLTELYDFRLFLLRFSMAGGNLGYLHYPVDLEGRQAFQTYCCYSAPFMAFDLNWMRDPNVGYGQIANMAYDAYSDGRFPWYSTPETNNIPVEHASRSGQSLLPWAAWKFYQIHGDKELICRLYPTMKRDMDWWISDRDPDSNGLFAIDDQMETGMDDLRRRWTGPAPSRYEAVDATSYAVLNLRAVANMARIDGDLKSAAYYAAYAAKAANALETVSWDPSAELYRDRNPDTGELSRYNAITTFYPLFAGVARRENLGVISRYLLNPKEYWTAYPVPGLSQSDPEFDPEHRYWAGLTWPATNSHVVEGFADTAKRLDRALLPQAAELFWRVARLHLRPRPDFYEHYNPLTGRPLSTFRDYMHSWWIDTIIRHVAGLTPQDDGSLVIDPLPMGLSQYALRGAPYRGHFVDVEWYATGPARGLTVTIDGRVVRRLPTFRPGGPPIAITASEVAHA